MKSKHILVLILTILSMGLSIYGFSNGYAVSGAVWGSCALLYGLITVTFVVDKRMEDQTKRINELEDRIYGLTTVTVVADKRMGDHSKRNNELEDRISTMEFEVKKEKINE